MSVNHGIVSLIDQKRHLFTHGSNEIHGNILNRGSTLHGRPRWFTRAGGLRIAWDPAQNSS